MDLDELRKKIKAAIGSRADDLANGARDEVQKWITTNGGSSVDADRTSADIRQQINNAISRLIDTFDTYTPS